MPVVDRSRRATRASPTGALTPYSSPRRSERPEQRSAASSGRPACRRPAVPRSGSRWSSPVTSRRRARGRRWRGCTSDLLSARSPAMNMHPGDAGRAPGTRTTGRRDARTGRAELDPGSPSSTHRRMVSLPQRRQRPLDPAPAALVADLLEERDAAVCSSSVVPAGSSATYRPKDRFQIASASSATSPSWRARTSSSSYLAERVGRVGRASRRSRPAAVQAASRCSRRRVRTRHREDALGKLGRLRRAGRPAASTATSRRRSGARARPRPRRSTSGSRRECWR